MRWLYIAVACVFGFGIPAHADPDVELSKLRTNLQDFKLHLNDPPSQILSTRELIAQFGLQKYVETGAIIGFRKQAFPAPKIRAGLDGQVMDMRLGMAMLTQTYGASENKVVIDAQGQESRQALVLMSGDATLADIGALLSAARLQESSAGHSLTLDVPLIIWTGAALRLQPGETLLLNRTRGAFVINFGHLKINGATIKSSGGKNFHSKKFNPFVATGGGGSVQLDQATIIGLGFGHSPKFSGFSVLRNALFPAQHPTHIINSRFSDLVSVAISGVSDVIIQGNNFRDMRGNAVSLSHSRYGRVVANIFSGKMQTNAIRVENGSVNSVVAGNIILGGKRAGIIVRHNSNNTRVTNNIIWKREGGGIMLAHMKCGQISDNLVFENAQKGVEIRSSQGSVIAKNRILSNHSAGIWVSAQKDAAQTVIKNNTLKSNGSGISTATGGSIILDGNDFSDQFPRLLGGDLALQSQHIVKNIMGEKQIIFTVGGQTDSIEPSEACANPPMLSTGSVLQGSQ